MRHTRVIPCLLLDGGGLVKTVKFRAPVYLGDPRNAVRIFNDKEVDELVLLDIKATLEGRSPNISLLTEIVSEAFMPIGYGGGIRTLDDARRVVAAGVEKIIVNSAALTRPALVRELSDALGSQSIVVSIDVRRTFFGRYEVVTNAGRRRTRREPVPVAVEMERCGAGELLLTSVDRDGTMQGYDLNLLRSVTDAVGIPVVASGGAGSLQHFRDAVTVANAAAVAGGSVFVFAGRHRAVLITYPREEELCGIE